MQRIIVIIILALIANFIFLSVGFGQNNSIGIQGVVPETMLNRNAHQQAEQPPTTTKENKYLYFFEKALSLQNDPTKAGEEAITIYDRVSSYGLMVGVLFIFATLLIALLRLIDWFVLTHKHKHIKLKI